MCVYGEWRRLLCACDTHFEGEGSADEDEDARTRSLWSVSRFLRCLKEGLCGGAGKKMAFSADGSSVLTDTWQHSVRWREKVTSANEKESAGERGEESEIAFVEFFVSLLEASAPLLLRSHSIPQTKVKEIFRAALCPAALLPPSSSPSSLSLSLSDVCFRSASRFVCAVGESPLLCGMAMEPLMELVRALPREEVPRWRFKCVYLCVDLCCFCVVFV